MKALDVISYVDKACNNTIDQDLKLKYLEWLDQQIAQELIDTHEEAGNVEERQSRSSERIAEQFSLNTGSGGVYGND